MRNKIKNVTRNSPTIEDTNLIKNSHEAIIRILKMKKKIKRK